MPKGGPKGNTKNFQHGAYSLLAMRAKGKPDGRSKLGRIFRAIEEEYMRDIGGVENLSRAQKQMTIDNTWCDLLIATIDFDLSRRKQLTRKGRPHAVIELRMRIAAHRRENYKLLGLKRVSKTLTLQEWLAQDADEPEPEPKPEQESSPGANGGAATRQNEGTGE